MRGLFFLSQEVGKQMIARKSGTIINIDSLNTNSPLKGVLPYAISKAGVSMMTRIRGASNEKAKAELGWRPRWASWREGFRDGLG